MIEARPISLSVLMPLWAGTPAEQFGRSWRSILAQTRTPEQFVLVADGALTDAHELEVAAMQAELSCVVSIVRLDHRQGVGQALAQGLAVVTGDWVARADSDDISLPVRFEVQCALASNGVSDVIGSFMAEFVQDPNQPDGVRVTPQSHPAILRRMRTANPMNHPTVMFRTTAVREAGGYLSIDGAEDYDLWARLAAKGARFTNIAHPLVAFRADAAMFRRRGAWKAIRGEVQLQRNLVAYGIVGRARGIVNVWLRVGFRLLPPPLMKMASRLLFRSRQGL